MTEAAATKIKEKVIRCVRVPNAIRLLRLGSGEQVQFSLSTIAAVRIQSLFRGSLGRKRFGFVKKLNDDIDAREAQAAEWRKQNGFGSVPREDIVVVFQAISLYALEDVWPVDSFNRIEGA